MPSHRRSDPVELLLKRIAQRALAGTLMGGLALAAGCADAEPSTASDLDEATDPSEQPTSPRLDPGRLRWSRRRPRPSRDAAVPPQDAGDAGVRDAGPSVPPEARGVACASDARFPVNAAGLQTSASFDSLQIRRVQGVFDPPDAGGGWADIPFERLSETGEPCRTATTPACSTQVARHPSELVAVRCADICSELSVVTTAGDEVKRWARPEEVRALLGPIDTVDEALLLVSVAGYDIRCNDPVRTAVRPLEDGFEVFATRMTNACAPIVITRYRLHVGRDGALRVLEQAELERDERACVGRRPDGYAPEGRGRADSLAAYLGDCAELEAASVAAFARLSRELEAHGAPSELVARARSSEADEVRHARTVGALARARGVEPHEPVLAGGDVRSLEEIALENAVEGCVRETFGALVGAHQAVRAEDDALREAMIEIAADEARHAALSHAVHAWIVPRLDEDARARVARAQLRAICELASGTGTMGDELQRAAGLPSTELSQAMIHALADALWLPALRAA